MKPKDLVFRVASFPPRSPIAIAMLFLLAARVGAQGGSWDGKVVVPKGPRVVVSIADKGKPVEFAELSYRVLEESDGWIRVVGLSYEKARIKKSDAVPLEDAEAYFSAVIKDSPKDPFAYVLRAHARTLRGALRTPSRIAARQFVFTPNRTKPMHAGGMLGLRSASMTTQPRISTRRC